MTSLSAITETLRAAAFAAGEIAMRHFRPGGQTSARIEYKQGGSPVTEADIAVNASLQAALAAAYPDIGWFSEESAQSPERTGMRRLFIVDPIDGTRAFIEGNPNWVMSLALVEDGVPVAAVLHGPAIGLTLTATRGIGSMANGEKISQRMLVNDPPVAAGPKPMLDSFEARGLALTRHPKIPSLALRLALVATGALDLAVASKNSHDWDIAAADLILAEAGIGLTDFSGRRPVYNRADPVHPPLVAGLDSLRARLLALG